MQWWDWCRIFAIEGRGSWAVEKGWEWVWWWSAIVGIIWVECSYGYESYLKSLSKIMWTIILFGSFYGLLVEF